MIRLPLDNPVFTHHLPPQQQPSAPVGMSDPMHAMARNRRFSDSQLDDSRFDDSVPPCIGSDWSPSSFLPDRLMNYAVRMVMPMRREFDLELDVSHFLYNGPYAREIIALAMTSRDARLRAYATFLNLQMFGGPQPPRSAPPQRTPAGTADPD